MKNYKVKFMKGTTKIKEVEFTESALAIAKRITYGIPDTNIRVSVEAETYITCGELIEELKKYPADQVVYVDSSANEYAPAKLKDVGIIGSELVLEGYL